MIPSKKLPEELLTLLLLKLPVKSLLRFRCVSKSWLKVIDSKKFIDLHSNHTKRNSKTFILSNIVEDTPDDIFQLTLDFDSRIVEARNLGLPVPYEYTQVLGCNNLICLSSSVTDHIIIWNPATHRHQEIPCKDKGNMACKQTVGFGYDCKTDDYKLVILDMFIVHVFRLKSNSWTQIPLSGSKYTLFNFVGRVPVYHNGYLHYLTFFGDLNSREYEIVTFDLAMEEWATTNPITMPLMASIKGLNFIELSTHNESLCASFGYYGSHIDFWMMKSDEDSWIKLFTFNIDMKVHKYLRIMAIGNLNPKNNMLIQKHIAVFFATKGKELQWYDIRNHKETKDLGTCFSAMYYDSDFQNTWYEGLYRL